MELSSSQLLANAGLNPSSGTSEAECQTEVLKYFLEYMNVVKASPHLNHSAESSPQDGTPSRLPAFDNASGGKNIQNEKPQEVCDKSIPATGEKTSTGKKPAVKPKLPVPDTSVKKRRGGYRMYSLAFKLAAVNYATQHSRMAASKKLGVKYELIRMWCTQRTQLQHAACTPNGKRRTKVFTATKKTKESDENPPISHFIDDRIEANPAETMVPGLVHLSSSSDGVPRDSLLSSIQASLQQNLPRTSDNSNITISLPDDSPKKQAKQCTYSIKFKLEVAEYCEKTGNKSATARKYGVDRKRVMDWVRDKEKLRQRLQEHVEQVPWEKEPTRLAGSGRKIISPTLEIRIISWIKELQRLGVKLSGQMICDKAMEYYRADENIQREQEMTHFTNFSASCGWLRSFLRRQNITLNHALDETDIPEDIELRQDMTGTLGTVSVGLDNGQMGTETIPGYIPDHFLLQNFTATHNEAHQHPTQ